MVAFTICSNNYLAEAISLGNSIINNTSLNVNFIIFLSDKYHNDINYKQLGFPVIEVDEKICSGFNTLIDKYNIIELSTAVKPGIFKYLMEKYESDLFYFFDPDIYFFNDIRYIQEELLNNDIILTPHVLAPTSDGIEPFENNFLNFGIYNLGFIGLKKNNNTINLLNWWEARTMKYGIIAPEQGLFVDQLWINFVPIYFEKVSISKHAGLNTAYWNINERVITKTQDGYIVNESHKLVFFHFSSFDFSLRILSKRPYTHPAYDNGIIKEFSMIYKKDLEKNNYSYFKQFTPTYDLTYDAFLRRKFSTDSRSAMIRFAEKLHDFTPKFLNKRIIRLGAIFESIKEIKSHQKQKVAKGS